MTRLVVHPRETVSFDEFCSAEQAPSVALDGYVEGPTRFSSRGGFATFDHHAGVDRLSTRATCEQVALAIRSGVPLTVAADGSPVPGLSVHVNDPDPDVALSWWLLNHPGAVSDPAVRTLVELEGMVDTMGGASLPRDLVALEVLAWVSDPWAQVRDRLSVASADEMAQVIFECCDRIDAVVAGSPGRLSLRASYETLAETAGIWAVVEWHPLARACAVLDGAEVVVAVRPGPTDSTRTVSVAKGNLFCDVDLEEVWAALNDAEGIEGSSRDRWGGSTLVGGSPRLAGTALRAEDICEVVAACYHRIHESETHLIHQ